MAGRSWTYAVHGSFAYGKRPGLPGPALTDGATDCHLQAAAVDIAAAGQIQCRAMVYRGADDRQPQRDIDGASKAAVLQYRQALVMIHGEDGIAGFDAGIVEQGVSRQWTFQIDALIAQALQRRDDDVDFLATQVAALHRHAG